MYSLLPSLSTTKKVALEFVTIVVGVLVALGVDEWRQDRQEQRDLTAHLATISEEIDSNLRTVGFIQQGLVESKFKALERVIAYLEFPDAPIEDPEALVTALARSASTMRPWLNRHSFESLVASGRLRLLADHGTADALGDTYQGFAVLLDQVAELRGEWRATVAGVLPTRLQAQHNPLRIYYWEDAPVIEDTVATDAVLEQLKANRLTLLPLARNEAAVATGTWYALARIGAQLTELKEKLEQQVGAREEG